MSKRPCGILVSLVANYSGIVGKYGPSHEKAREFRRMNAANEEFIGYADALDRVKLHLGGSGIDYPPREKD